MGNFLRKHTKTSRPVLLFNNTSDQHCKLQKNLPQESLFQSLLCHIQPKLPCFFSSKIWKFPIQPNISYNTSHLWYFQWKAFQCLDFISCYIFCFHNFLLIAPILLLLLLQYYINWRWFICLQHYINWRWFICLLSKKHSTAGCICQFY